MVDVEGNFADLSFEDKEEEEEEEEVVQLALERLDLGASFENSFVGSFFTSSVVNFQSIRAMLANVWHLIRGISISDLNKGRFLFQLYHKVDTARIEAGSPWNFNSYFLVMCRLKDGDDPKIVPLFNVDFWVLVQDLPHGFMSELVAK
ncbi:hypothetical protein J1N35_024869 [Gossypium stocksii]|uniref:DUF4283 domain-containing protein n=1 Tax=Gossypium stocksii TaxID=47602 RepID=A0A9D3ZX51_9ROSI|nr:hypothetical protein J1N35_024869 [Gossypium stocksii]